jgi:hypothetical protein
VSRHAPQRGASEPSHRRVLYIAGSGRSGSTLLDRLLGQVPGMVSVGELRQIWFRAAVRGDGLCGCLKPFGECPFWSKVGQVSFGGWDAPEVAEAAHLRRGLDRALAVPRLLTRTAWRDADRYADLLGCLISATLSVSGAEVVVDSSKTPAHGLMLHRIDGADVRTVHLVRDSRGVVFSWQRGMEERRATNIRRPQSSQEGSDDPLMRSKVGVVSASVHWFGYNALAPVLGTAGGPRIRLRYEDLLAEPVVGLRRILDFAGVRSSQKDLGFLRDRQAQLGVDHTVHGSNRIRFAVGEIPLRLDDEWHREMPAGRRRIVTALTWPLLALYGYRPMASRDGEETVSQT